MALQIRSPGGLNLGTTDVNLYRQDAHILRTDDTLEISVAVSGASPEAILTQSNSGNTGAVTGVQEVTASLASTATTGNCLFLAVCSDGYLPNDADDLTDQGWTEIEADAGTNATYLYYRVAGVGEQAWTFSAISMTSWAILEYAGLAGGVTPQSTTTSANGANVSAFSTGTTEASSGCAGGLAIAVFGYTRLDAQTATVTAVSNEFTEVEETFTSAAVGNVGVSVATLALAANGTRECTATFDKAVYPCGLIVNLKAGTAATSRYESVNEAL
jgi:hypothetical protein